MSIYEFWGLKQAVLLVTLLKITQAKSGEYVVNYGPFSYNKCQYSSHRYSGLEHSRLEFQIRFELKFLFPAVGATAVGKLFKHRQGLDHIG